MGIDTSLKLYTAVVTVPFYYAPAEGTSIINIIAKNIEEALVIAKQYVL